MVAAGMGITWCHAWRAQGKFRPRPQAAKKVAPAGVAYVHPVPAVRRRHPEPTVVLVAAQSPV
jgi:hypothetical protein